MTERASLATEFVLAYEAIKARLEGVADWFAQAMRDLQFMAARRRYRECIGD